MRTSYEDFIRAWAKATCVAEVAMKLGKSKDAVRSMAAYLRKKGMLLKHMRASRWHKKGI